MRDVCGPPHHGQAGRKTRPKRLAPHRPGQKREGLPQPHQIGVPRLDEGLLHAPPHRPQRTGEIPRRAHRLLGLPGRRNPEKNHCRTLRRSRGSHPMVQKPLRRRLLPGASATQSHRAPRQPRSLPPAAKGERQAGGICQEIQHQAHLYQRRALRGRRKRRSARPPHLPQHRQGSGRPHPHALHQAGVDEDQG